MLAAAHADKEVGKELGATYLKHVAEDVAHAEDRVAKRPAEISEAHTNGARLTTLAEQAIKVMETIRGRADLAELPAETLVELGRGKKWTASMPDEVARDAAGMAKSLDGNHDAATKVHATPQVRHDLAHLAKAISDLHVANKGLRAEGKASTHAKASIMAALRADAHHIRLAAHVLHRGDEEKLAAFESTIPMHVVAHHTRDTLPSAAPGTPSTPAS
jgi:hypothetical protein